MIDKHKLIAYLHGDLSEDENLAVQLFLSEHIEDPEVKEVLESSFDASRAEPDTRAKKALSNTRSQLGIRKFHTGYLIGGFAALILLLSIPAAFKAGYNHRQLPETQWRELTVPAAQTRMLTLADGSVLTLNAGSRITWPESFRGRERSIFLDGEVLAEIAKDPEHPFVIHSGDIDVNVHGTTFNFKSYSSDATAEIVLIEGSVSMDIPTSQGERQIHLTPGDIAQWDRNSENISMSRIPADSFRPFNQNKSFNFINIPLEDIASDLERAFGRRIIIADENARSRRFLAFFTNGESLEEILEMLAQNGQLRIADKDNTIYIYNKNTKIRH